MGLVENLLKSAGRAALRAGTNDKRGFQTMRTRDWCAACGKKLGQGAIGNLCSSAACHRAYMAAIEVARAGD